MTPTRDCCLEYALARLGSQRGMQITGACLGLVIVGLYHWFDARLPFLLLFSIPTILILLSAVQTFSKEEDITDELQLIRITGARPVQALLAVLPNKVLGHFATVLALLPFLGLSGDNVLRNWALVIHLLLATFAVILLSWLLRLLRVFVRLMVIAIFGGATAMLAIAATVWIYSSDASANACLVCLLGHAIVIGLYWAAVSLLQEGAYARVYETKLTKHTGKREQRRSRRITGSPAEWYVRYHCLCRLSNWGRFLICLAGTAILYRCGRAVADASALPGAIFGVSLAATGILALVCEALTRYNHLSRQHHDLRALPLRATPEALALFLRDPIVGALKALAVPCVFIVTGSILCKSIIPPLILLVFFQTTAVQFTLNCCYPTSKDRTRARTSQLTDPDTTRIFHYMWRKFWHALGFVILFIPGVGAILAAIWAVRLWREGKAIHDQPRDFLPEPKATDGKLPKAAGGL